MQAELVRPPVRGHEQEQPETTQSWSPYNSFFLASHISNTKLLTSFNNALKSSLFQFSNPKLKLALLKLSSVLNSPNLPPNRFSNSTMKLFLMLSYTGHSQRTCTTLSHSPLHNLHCLSSFLPLCLPNSSFRPFVPDRNLNNNLVPGSPTPCK